MKTLTSIKRVLFKSCREYWECSGNVQHETGDKRPVPLLYSDIITSPSALSSIGHVTKPYIKSTIHGKCMRVFDETLDIPWMLVDEPFVGI